MARRFSHRIGGIGEVNMTPLMDLTFILLITFIITFPLVEQGVPVNLPSGKSQPLEEQETCTVSVNAENAVFLDDVQLSQDALVEALKDRLAAEPGLVTLLRGDAALPYGKVVDVLRRMNDAGITKVAIVTAPE